MKNLKLFKDHHVRAFLIILMSLKEGMTVRWVISDKSIDGNNSIKTRLVARGFEEGEDSPIRRDWPICTKESLRLTLVTAF